MSCSNLPAGVYETPTQYTDRTVRFHHPFSIGASAEVYPAGQYVVEVGESTFEGNSRAVHVRNSTVLVIRTSAGSRNIQVSENDLITALASDAERHADGPNENPDRGRAQ